MKIERKRKNPRRQKKQRHFNLVKRATKNSTAKSNSNGDTINEAEISTSKLFIEKRDFTETSNTNFATNLYNKAKSINFLSSKLLLITSFCIVLVFVTLNINPILKYVITDQNSAVYPVLKKYADELRNISNRLTVVTRRLNMLSLVSEENDLNNISRINSLVLQINEMWFTTKKYLNFIGIETIAHTELEKEIEVNSKVNEKGLIRETKVEESFPEDQITLTSVLKLDSIIQDLDIQIDSINNEITYLEDNVYAAIKASHIYSHLLERSRNANGNYYANSTVATTPNNNYQLNNQQVAIQPKKISIANNSTVETKKLAKIETIPKTTRKIEIPKIKKSTPVIISSKTIKQTIVNNKHKAKPTKKVVVAKVKVKRQKIVGAFTLKDKQKEKSRKDKSNKLSKKTIKEPKIITAKSTTADKKAAPNKETTVVVVEEPFENPFLEDDIILDFVSNYDDYGDIEEETTQPRNSNPIEEDDYTGG